jgi:uncharacterized protein (DUF1810 family)
MQQINYESEERLYGDFSQFLNIIEANGEQVITELTHCKKQSHWMWYIFPQLICLGSSPISKYYGLKNLKEAELYANDEVLGRILIHITKIVVNCIINDKKTLREIFGGADEKKFLSSMTLFSYTTLNSANGQIFTEARNLAERELRMADEKTKAICERELQQRGGKNINSIYKKKINF